MAGDEIPLRVGDPEAGVGCEKGNILCSPFQEKKLDVIAGILPFLAVELVSLVMIFAYPPTSTLLPRYAG